MMKKLVTLAVLLISIFAFTSMAAAANWKVPGNFSGIQAAVNAAKVKSGDTILVGAGDFAGAKFTTEKKLTIKGAGVDKTVITGGPKFLGTKAGFWFANGGSGSTIQNMSFEVDFPIYGQNAMQITVTNTKMTAPVQGITNWGGNKWKITDNVIRGMKTYSASGSDGAGGIGILIGNREATRTASMNWVLRNTITGKIVGTSGAVPSAVGGIVLFADYSDGRPGMMKTNRIKTNDLGVTKTANILNLHQIGLNEARDPAPASHCIKENVVVDNDFILANPTKVECYPAVLQDLNTIKVPVAMSIDADVAVSADFNPL